MENQKISLFNKDKNGNVTRIGEACEKSIKAFHDFEKAARSIPTPIFSFNIKVNHIPSLMLKKTKLLNDVIGDVANRANDAICPSCDLYNTHCEGSRCEEQSVYYFEGLEDQERKKAIIDAMGKDFYNNLSLSNKIFLTKNPWV